MHLFAFLHLFTHLLIFEHASKFQGKNAFLFFNTDDCKSTMHRNHKANACLSDTDQNICMIRDLYFKLYRRTEGHSTHNLPYWIL